MYFCLIGLRSGRKLFCKALALQRELRIALPRTASWIGLDLAWRMQPFKPLSFSRHIFKAPVLYACLIAGLPVAVADPADDVRRVQADALRAAEIESLIANDSNSFVLSLGDRVKIVFFEKFGADGDELAANGYVERVELSGEYTVQQDGNIFLPLLDSMHVAGISLQQMQARLERAYLKMFGRAASASVLLVDREPVYVVGPVTRPGKFKFAPGMTVLHAVAMSGGLENGTAEILQFLELVREKERMQKANDRIKNLLARRAVLTAERIGGGAEASPRLVELAGEAHAAELLTALTSMRKLAANSRNAQIASAEASIEAGKKELRTLHARVDHIDTNMKNRSERLGMVRRLHERGSTGGIQVHQASSDLAEVQERMQDVMAAITRTEQRIAQAIQEKIKIVTDAQIELERDLYATEIDIAQEEVTLSMSRNAFLAVNRTINPPASRSKVSFEILRRTSSGVRVLDATETSPLEPGDLVRIRAET